MIEFKVITWDFNTKKVEYYDIMPYLRRSWEEGHDNFSLTFDSIKEFILRVSRYQFWSRCQYEVVVTGFPEDGKNSQKIDVYDQIESNLDIITNLFLDYLNEKD